MAVTLFELEEEAVVVHSGDPKKFTYAAMTTEIMTEDSIHDLLRRHLLQNVGIVKEG